MKVVLNATVIEACHREVVILTDEGKKKSYKGADFVYWALARENMVVANPLIKGGLITEADLDPKGRIHVRRTLQLLRHENIFAVGDCSLVASSPAGRTETFFAAIESGRFAAGNVVKVEQRNNWRRTHHGKNERCNIYPNDGKVNRANNSTKTDCTHC